MVVKYACLHAYGDHGASSLGYARWQQHNIASVGLGETIPFLSGISDLSSEATSLNNTAATLTRDAQSGRNAVAQINRQGVDVSMLQLLHHAAVHDLTLATGVSCTLAYALLPP